MPRCLIIPRRYIARMSFPSEALWGWISVGVLQIALAIFLRGKRSLILAPLVLVGHFVAFTFPKIYCLFLLGAVPEDSGVLILEAKVVAGITLAIAAVCYFGKTATLEWPRISPAMFSVATITAIVPSHLPLGPMTTFFALISFGATVLVLSPNTARYKHLGIAAILLHAFIHYLETGSLVIGVTIAIVLFARLVLSFQIQTAVALLAWTATLGVLQWGKPELRAISKNIGLTERAVQVTRITHAKIQAEATLDGEKDMGVLKSPLGGKRYTSAFLRAGDSSLGRVLSRTPERVPFWNGSSYQSILSLFLPRLFFPKKPAVSVWNEFGRRYGYLDAHDRMTSVGFNLFAEGYMNFGWMGLIWTTVCFAIALVFLERNPFFQSMGAGAFGLCWTAAALAGSREAYSMVAALIGILAVHLLCTGFKRLSSYARILRDRPTVHRSRYTFPTP